MATHAPDMNMILIIRLVAAAVVIGIIVLRNLRPRRLRVELLWVRPVIFLVLVGLYFVGFPPKSVIDVAGVVIGFAIGAGLGWWRGSLTRIDVDPATDTAMQQASPFGILLILGLLAVRTLLSMGLIGGGLALPVSLNALTGWLLALAVGVAVLQQLEIWLRARKVMAAAKAGK